MGLEYLEKSVLQGDREAFKEWMELYIRAIERLAVQYGMRPQDAGKLAESIFGNLYNELGQLIEEQLEEKALFKTSLQSMKELQVQTSEMGLFPFEEDNELHAQLIDLPIEERIAFILSNLHGKSNEDIAWIMETHLENVQALLSSARAKLDRTDIEKRLEFLNSSFHRLRPSYNERNIYYSTRKEDLNTNEPVKIVSRQRKPFLLWFVGVAMLVLLLSVTVLRSDAYQQSSAEKFIEKKKISFQQELDDRFELIGLPEPDEYEAENYVHYSNGTQMKQEIYSKNAKWEFYSLIRDLEDQAKVKGKIDKKEASKRYDSLIHELRLPSEMLEQLKKDSLADDRKDSMEFIKEFYDKHNYFRGAYMRVFMDHAEYIWGSELFNGGMVDIEEFIAKKPEFPIELQKAIDGMETQLFSLTAIKDFEPLSLKYEDPQVRKTLKENLHPDMEVYISLLMDSSIIYFDSYSEQLEKLLELEKQLPKMLESDPIVYDFDDRYIWLLYFMSGLADANGIYESDHVVKEEIREKWRRIASIGENSPAANVMQEIIGEMEASNWKSSHENEIYSEFPNRFGSKLKEARNRNE